MLVLLIIELLSYLRQLRARLHKHIQTVVPGVKRPSANLPHALGYQAVRYDRYLQHRPPHYRYLGRISPRYWDQSYRFHILGPSYYPRYCWYPHWTRWVHWVWGCRPRVICDPRPVWCRPVVYAPAVRWCYYTCPTWVFLPSVSCGTWVDVPPVPVGPRFDLQLLAVRFVDPGHPEQLLGPRFRVWFRNNSDRPITQPFDVILFASEDNRLVADLPQSGVRVTAVEAGDTQSVDLRLPYDVYAMQDGRNEPSAFQTLHVLVDANREIPETSEANNGTRLPVADVLPIDPAAFELEPREAPAGSEVVIAGEGFGPEAGQVLLHLGDVEMEADILGWYDLGVRLAVPNLPLAGPTTAELVVVRGDGAVASPLSITLLPPRLPVEEIPAPSHLP